MMPSHAEVHRAGVPHICVCICTYKRALPLKRLLNKIQVQETQGLFTYSVVIVDNDERRSGEAAVAESRQGSAIAIDYYVEPQQGIAYARNKAVESAAGDYLAFIDDDEFPIATWLLRMFETCNRYQADGVLGPVRRHFDGTPPSWLRKSRILDRRVHATGDKVDWRDSRTGNVLLKRRVIAGDGVVFRTEFRTGEDKDFFCRKIEDGFSFIWSSDAEVFEVLPASRWKRSYFIKRALFNGAMGPKMGKFGWRDVLKAVVAIPLYGFLLPFSLLFGQHRFMTLMMKFSNHLGRLLAMAGIHVVRGTYLTADED
jgi:glycosyltransferase involved in cell wall biosynthesis